MNKKIFMAVVAMLSIAMTASAQKVYDIYDGVPSGSENWTDPELIINGPSGRPLIYNVSRPTIAVYKPEKQIDTHTAVIICPGGANMYLTWEEEGVNVARWLQTQGITGIVLKYRTQQLGKSEEEVSKKVRDMLNLIFGGRSDAGEAQENVNDNYAVLSEATPTLQGDDGRQAIMYVRQHAEELGVDPHKIGIIGFSAGGMVTTNTMMIHDADSRPDFAGPIYGVGGYNKLPDNRPEFDLGPADGAIALYKAWREAEQPAELHFIIEANHGEGLLYNGREWMEWKDLFLNFLKAIKMI